MDTLEKTRQESPYGTTSPRLVLRFSDIRSGLRRTSLSASFSEPNSPSGLCLNNISKTLCTPSPQRARRFRRNYDITPKSETKRRVDLGSPQLKANSLPDYENNLPNFRQLQLDESLSCRRPIKGRCLALSFQDSPSHGIDTNASTMTPLTSAAEAQENPMASVQMQADQQNSVPQHQQFEASLHSIQQNQSFQTQILSSTQQEKASVVNLPMQQNLQPTVFNHHEQQQQIMHKPIRFQPSQIMYPDHLNGNHNPDSALHPMTEKRSDCDLCTDMYDADCAICYTEQAQCFFCPIKQEPFSSQMPPQSPMHSLPMQPQQPNFTQIRNRPLPVPDIIDSSDLIRENNTSSFPDFLQNVVGPKPEQNAANTEGDARAQFSFGNLPCPFCVSDYPPTSQAISSSKPQNTVACSCTHFNA